jgi:hypothetical protein
MYGYIIVKKNRYINRDYDDGDNSKEILINSGNHQQYSYDLFTAYLLSLNIL